MREGEEGRWAWGRYRWLVPNHSCHQFLIFTLPLQEPQWITPSWLLLPPSLFAPPTSPLAIFSQSRGGTEVARPLLASSLPAGAREADRDP